MAKVFDGPYGQQMYMVLGDWVSFEDMLCPLLVYLQDWTYEV